MPYSLKITLASSFLKNKLDIILTHERFFNTLFKYPNPKIEIILFDAPLRGTNLALSLTPSAFTKNSRRTDGWD